MVPALPPRRQQGRAVHALAVGALAVGALAVGSAAATSAALTSPASTSWAGAAPPAAADVIPQAYVVTLHDDVGPSTVAAEHGRQYGAQVEHVYRHALNGYAARMSDEAARQVARDRRVVAVEADRVVTTKAEPGQTVGIPPQALPTGISRIGADASSTLAGNGSGAVDVDVAVIDTGIELQHPDLDVVGGRNCVSGGSYADGNGHGTHVAGTIAAADDAAGVVGVAPGARLWAVRVLDDAGSGTTSSVLCGIDWVTANAATIEVANMSISGSGAEPSGTGCSTGDAYHDAICRSVATDVTYVVAAGNGAADAAGAVPAAYDEVITVSALADVDGLPGGLGTTSCRAETDADDTFASFSNSGTDVDLIAPGTCIGSTWLAGTYRTLSGTSMAAPHVTGAAALYLASHPGAAPATVRTALRDAGADDWSGSDDPDGVQEPLVDVSSF